MTCTKFYFRTKTRKFKWENFFKLCVVVAPQRDLSNPKCRQM